MDHANRRRLVLERDEAVARVETAWAEGRIAGADRDRRLAELSRAVSLEEIAMATHDLRLGGVALAAPADGLDGPDGTLGMDDTDELEGLEGLAVGAEHHGATGLRLTLLIPLVIVVAFLASCVAVVVLLVGLLRG